MNVPKCPRGKVINPATGRCVKKNSPLLRKNMNNNVLIYKNDGIQNLLINCGKNKYVNPNTGRCVQLSNNDIQHYLLNRGYKLQTGSGPAPILVGPPKVPQGPPKVPQGPPKVPQVSTNDENVKLLINCGKNKYVNPYTGRCVQLSNNDIKYFLNRGYKLQTGPGPAPMFVVQRGPPKRPR